MIGKLYRKIGWMLSAGTILLSGCAEDNHLENLTAGGENRGMTVVDYAVGEMMTHSVSHVALPANKRISSLTYMLFNDKGKLEDMREIPDINENTVWPLKRATMTWEQRDALRDTLKVGRHYTAVFLANVAPSLFGNEEVLHFKTQVGGGVQYHNLEEVYLTLPKTVAFGDNNMYYFALHEITPTAANDREHPYNCPVMLERIVSRTDFFSDDYPAWGTEYANGKVREFTDRVYDQLIPLVAKADNPMLVNDMLKRFTKEFYDYTVGYTLIPGEGVVYAGWVADLANNMNNMDCSAAINGCVLPADATAIKEMLYQSCLNNERLKGLWQPWAGMKAKVAYTQSADRFYLSTSKSSVTAGAGEMASPLLDIDLLTDAAGGKQQNVFTLIGFGENQDATDGTVQNKMKEVQLFATGTEAEAQSILPLRAELQSFAGQGGNERVQLSYCPIKTLKYNGGFKSGQIYRLPPVNMKQYLPASLFVSSVYMGRLQEFFDSEKGRKYGKSIEEFVLEVTIPDLSHKDALTVEPEWTLKQ